MSVMGKRATMVSIKSIHTHISQGAMVFLLLLMGCSQELSKPLNIPPNSPKDYYSQKVNSYLSKINIPKSRSFYMGFTDWPYDLSPEAYTYTQNKIASHADFIAFHLDQGVPWPEALEGKNQYHPSLTKIIQDKVNSIPRGFVRYVSTSAQAQDRRTLALYWGKDDNRPLPSKWNGKEFDDPDVVKAYLNWCRYLLDTFKPQYFNYGIEVNHAFTGLNDSRFVAFKRLISQVYPILKKEYPKVALILEFVDGSIEVSKKTLMTTAKALTRYTDVIGISTYPYGLVDHPNDIRKDWISDLSSLDPNKPIGITETGWNGDYTHIPLPQNIVDYLNTVGLKTSIIGNEEEQVIYTQKLLSTVNGYDTRFVIWWQIRDYDSMIRTLDKLGMNLGLGVFWKDIGFYDDNGNKRPALDVWQRWLDRAKREN